MSSEKETSVDEIRQAITYYNVASMHMQHKQVEQAVSYYLKAIEELRTKGIKQHKFNVILLESLAVAYGVLEQHESSASYYLKAIKMSLIVNKDLIRCVKLSFNLAEAYEKVGRVDDAFGCLCKAYEVMTEEYGEDSPEADDVMDRLMQLRDRMSKMENHLID